MIVALSIGGLAAQNVKTIHSFNGADGEFPQTMVLTQGRDGRLYGTAEGNFGNDLGTIFKERAGGAVVVVHKFDGSDGTAPQSGLTLARDGNFYSSAIMGGTFNQGTLFRLTSAGVLTVLHHFTGGADGGFPIAPPVEASDGNLYGTTSNFGGANTTLYKLTASGTFSTLDTFDQTVGYNPFDPLIQGADGKLYLTMQLGAAFGCGSIVKMTLDGKIEATYSFDCGDGGGAPIGPLLQASDGNFYGTTEGGGKDQLGTIFRITADWTFTTLYSFKKINNDGLNPACGLTQGTDGNLYGTTSGGGTASSGTIFQISLDGVYKQLYSFPSNHPAFPTAAPTQHTNGTFFGPTVSGGANGLGSIYTLNMRLGPFITFVRAQGKVGTKAQILGQGFTGATSVTFNGIPAISFNVARDTYMTAVVPAGATTGPVVVATPTGTLTSNVSFRVSK